MEKKKKKRNKTSVSKILADNIPALFRSREKGQRRRIKVLIMEVNWIHACLPVQQSADDWQG